MCVKVPSKIVIKPLHDSLSNLTFLRNNHDIDCMAGKNQQGTNGMKHATA